MFIEILLSLIVIFMIWKITKKPPNYPPGPWGLPLIGYIPLGSNNFNKHVEQLRKQYGDVLSWRIGTKLIVLLCDFKMVKEVFRSQTFVDRPSLKVLNPLVGENVLGVLSTNGVHWHSLRRFSLRHLRDLGMGKSKLVSSVQFEATELVKEMKKQAGKAAPVPQCLAAAVFNVIWQLVTGKRYDVNSAEIHRFQKLMREVEENMSLLSISDIFPWVESLMPEFVFKVLFKTETHSRLSNELKAFLKNHIDEHVKTLDKSNPRDYIDDYLIEMENQESDPDSTMSMEDLTYTVSDLFGAGTETVKTTIQWAIYYMASFPSVQKRLQKEIDSVLQKGTQATLEDKPKLPYLDAFIHETLRYSSLVRNGIPHEASVDTTLGGYLVPKGAFVMTAAHLIHFDAKYFESPNEFSPERFLDSEGKFVSPKEGFLPFGIGRRQCLGESLARMELFIFLSTLIQNLKFSAPPGKIMDLDPIENPLIAFTNHKQNVLITVR